MRDTGYLVALVLVAVASSASVRQWFSRTYVTPCPATLLPGISVAAPTMSTKIIPRISRAISTALDHVARDRAQADASSEALHDASSTAPDERLAPRHPGAPRHLRASADAPAAPCPAQTPPPNPTGAECGDGRVLSSRLRVYMNQALLPGRLPCDHGRA